MTLRLATRGSPLARWQAERVASLIGRVPGTPGCELVVVRTAGDDATGPISAIGGQGIFVAEVQAAVLDGRADLAVHSAKDLPSRCAAGLVLAAVPERGDPRDGMVGLAIDDLPTGAAVATGSPRRRAQLSWLRPDLTYRELRGNMATRLAKSRDLGAGVLAVCALERLGLDGQLAQRIGVELMLPQVGQGALAVECREDDAVALEVSAAIDDHDSHVAVAAERAWLAAMGGGCSAPVAAYARCSSGGVTLEAMVATGDGRIVVRRRAHGLDPAELGADLARAMAPVAAVVGIDAELESEKGAP